MPLPTLLRGISLWTDRHAMYGPKATSRSPVSPLDLVPAKESDDETSLPVDTTTPASSTPPPPAEESTPVTTTETES
jgi:hypothetical protein